VQVSHHLELSLPGTVSWQAVQDDIQLVKASQQGDQDPLPSSCKDISAAMMAPGKPPTNKSLCHEADDLRTDQVHERVETERPNTVTQEGKILI